MGLQSNVANAMLAVAHVNSVMTVGASNKFSDIMASYGGVFGCVLGTRLGQLLIDWHISQPAWAAKKLQIQQMAIGAEKAGCGNCGEQSAIAWSFLYDMHVRPLDWMSVSNGDHAFVLIGRADGSKENDPSTWGDEAVVCDPWYKKVYIAQSITSNLPHASFESLLRAD